MFAPVNPTISAMVSPTKRRLMPELPPHLQRKHQRLLARIQRRYKTRTQDVRWGDVGFTFTRIADPEQVLDDVADEETRRTKINKDGSVTFTGEPLRMPYWAELWESAEAISQWLVENRGQGAVGRRQKRRGSAPETTDTLLPKKKPFQVNDIKIPAPPLSPPSPLPPAHCPLPTALDLGCGMGLAGCTAAALGYAVTFADIEAPALLFAELNALPFANVTCRKTNWQCDDLGRRFDLIIGADILYERTQWDFLEPFWRNHLTDTGLVVLGEPGRPTSETFPTWINAKGWTVRMEKRAVPGRPEPIRLILLNR